MSTGGRAQAPHSRACGYKKHDHGPDCHSNCPTCAGRYKTACTGAATCPEPYHVHGCYADLGNCDNPHDHSWPVADDAKSPDPRADPARRLEPPMICDPCRNSTHEKCIDVVAGRTGLSTACLCQHKVKLVAEPAEQGEAGSD